MNETVICLLPRAVEDLLSINAFWRRNIAGGESEKLVLGMLADLKTLKQFYPAAEGIRYEPLKSEAYKFFRCRNYIFICKKIENVIYIYHAAHEESEYPGILSRR